MKSMIRKFKDYVNIDIEFSIKGSQIWDQVGGIFLRMVPSVDFFFFHLERGNKNTSRAISYLSTHCLLFKCLVKWARDPFINIDIYIYRGYQIICGEGWDMIIILSEKILFVWLDSFPLANLTWNYRFIFFFLEMGFAFMFDLDIFEFFDIITLYFVSLSYPQNGSCEQFSRGQRFNV